MFEDSLFSSQRQIITPRKRWITIVSIGIQLAIAGAILLIPLLSTQSLPRLATAPAKVSLTQPRTPPKPPKPVPVRLAATASNALSAPAVERVQSAEKGRIASSIPDQAPSLLAWNGPLMGNGPSLPVSIGTSGNGTAIHVVASGPGKKSGPLPVSSGVTTGLLLDPIKPVYPAIARITHTQGTVVLSAIIDKSGRITRLQVVSGSAMLQNAALDAVRIARYRPFLLNGEPTEVETTITVNFRMDS